MTHFQFYSSVPGGRKGLFVNTVRAWEWWRGTVPGVLVGGARTFLRGSVCVHLGGGSAVETAF